METCHTQSEILMNKCNDVFCLFWSFSCSVCSGLLTVLLHCSSEMNLKRRSPFSYIPFSFCISTSYRYILVCDWTSWNSGPLHQQWPWSWGKLSNYGTRIFWKCGCFFSFFLIKKTQLNSRQWGCWKQLSMYKVLSLLSLVNKKHMVLQLKILNTDFSVTSAILSP